MQVKLNDGSVMVAGMLTNNAESGLTREKKTPTAKFSLAVGKRKDTTTIFVDCKAFGKLANVAGTFKKGDSVFVIGRIDTYISDKTGKTYTTLIADYLSAAARAFTAAAAPASADVYPDDKPLDTSYPSPLDGGGDHATQLSMTGDPRDDDDLPF